MKKNVLTLSLGLMLCSQAFAQQVGIGTNTPNASARLDIASGGTMGILFPRVALTATNVASPVTSPANWLTVFNTATAGSGTTAVVPGLYYWNGTAWVKLDTGSALGDWKVDGNSNGAFRTLGTDDAFDLGLETNGAERMRITSVGRVGIGTTNPSYTLTLSGSSTFGYGNGSGTYSSRTETRTNAGLQGNAGAQSGFFETEVPAPAANWYPGTSGWQHLLDIRHSNEANNYAMQFAGSFFDQNLWFRKTNNNPAQAWSRILTTLDNGNFIQNQYTAAQTTANYWVSGNGRMDGGLTVGAGATIDNNNTNTGTVSAGAIAFGNASGEGIGSKRNAGGNQYGLDFYTASANRMAITQAGNVGIGTTAPSNRLHVAAAEGQGIDIGIPNDAMGLNGGSTAIRFYGYRDVTNNAFSAKISAERTNVCCGYLSQGTDLAFYTNNGLTVANADNSVERMRVKGNGTVNMSRSVFFDCNDCGSTTAYDLADGAGGNWGDLAIQGRVLSTNSNLHLSPPGGSRVIINSAYRSAGGGTGTTGLDIEDGGIRMRKNYAYIQRYAYTGSASGVDNGFTNTLGNWDFCSLAHVGFKNNASGTDEDDDVQCAVYPSSAGAGEQTNYDFYFTEQFNTRRTWFMYMEAYEDTNGITCAASCINFD